MMELFVDFFLISGIVLILIILFLLGKPKELPNRILFLIFILLLSVLLQSYGVLHKIVILYLLGFFLTEPIGYILGPLLYLYIKSLHCNNENLIHKNIIHFVPFLIYMFFIVIPVIISMIIGEPLFSYLKTLQEASIPEIEVFIQDGFSLGYSIFAIRLLNQYQDTLKLNFSNLHNKDLNWVKNLLIGISTITSLDILILIYNLAFNNTGWEIGSLIIFSILVLTLYLGYYGVFQSQILIPDFILNNHERTNSFSKKYSENRPIVYTNISEIENLKSQLLEVIEKEKPYLNEDLTLGILAKSILTTDKKLSSLLNQHMHISFYDFINNYRVEEVKIKIANPLFENYTLIAIAYDSGFKSKTSFNRIFKKRTGLSPSQFRKKISTKNS